MIGQQIQRAQMRPERWALIQALHEVCPACFNDQGYPPYIEVQRLKNGAIAYTWAVGTWAYWGDEPFAQQRPWIAWVDLHDSPQAAAAKFAQTLLRFGLSADVRIGGVPANPDLAPSSSALHSLSVRVQPENQHSGLVNPAAENRSAAPAPSCESCRFFAPTLDEELGACRRRAPTITRKDIDLGIWPETHTFEWCGEYEFAPGALDG